MNADIHLDVRRYYGEVLQSSQDLKTGACCTADAMPWHLRGLMADLHPEIVDRFYGCGSPIPPALEGMTVLDLGCGTGRDAYLLSRLVGEQGRVIGVDMTPEQLEVARRHQDWHRERYGHAASNVRFVEGYIEDLQRLRHRGCEHRRGGLQLRAEPCPGQGHGVRGDPAGPQAGRRAVLLRRIRRPPHSRRVARRPGAAGRMPVRRAVPGGFPQADAAPGLRRCPPGRASRRYRCWTP